jgi:hypothetical protein
MEPDFSGWATKANLKCSDGRTILSDAFKHMDGQQVPLVWQHGHNDAGNVLGYAILKHTADGVRADGYFNTTAAGANAKQLVEHGDIKALSIYANQLVEKSKNVIHGFIREVSLVLAGANPGAKIDFVNVRHSDGSIDELEDEAVIHSGTELFHDDVAPVDDAPNDTTVQEVWDSLSPEQQDVVSYLVGAAVEAAQDPDGDGDNDAEKGVEADQAEAAQHSDNNDNQSDEDDVTHKEGTGGMTRNVFDQTNTGTEPGKHVISHADQKGIFADAMKIGSLKEAVDNYALQHGIEPIDILFPNFTNLTNTPQFNSRRMEWVQGVLDGTSKTPFSAVRSIVADITQDEARALGYIKGSFKKEEWFTVTKRTTTATTVYKKQKLDRDDIIDITDFDVVAWMKVEMSMMLREELARAILIGDGRDIADPDKIQDPSAATSGAGIRSIVNEHELYKTDVFVNIADANSSYVEVIESIVRSMEFYKGTGTPTFYTTLSIIAKMLLLKDTLGRRLYNSKADLAAAMMVSDIVAVEVMNTMPNVLGIVVNLADYNIGANKGGEVSLFDFFDIDYNQYKYLAETRVSGALTKVKSALVIQTTTGTNVLATPTSPTFVKATGVVTIPAVTGVVYKNSAGGGTLTAGAQTALTAGQELNVYAVPASGYYFETTGTTVEWHFEVGSTTSTS